eukprot:CAMPEP_0175963270 /NCGR_PEP_ID=MMETSP0108-20121206/36928_1 /TAXON_ID=195067 ORGANISM="Goniomonas pacifica, Strain CCMP1869" /NCGR_SAMPLE_ID=MMETSP0108 /ASSEMBLY_ACC=CAM_ASM_000204 /LENGTH=57 /DNA_ID=CAMNT_0017291153 /DNA_START=459 /DNA_END=632 /DNA_ORIENTATION=-
MVAPGVEVGPRSCEELHDLDLSVNDSTIQWCAPIAALGNAGVSSYRFVAGVDVGPSG